MNKKQEIIDFIRKTPKFELQIDGLGLKHWCFFDGEKPVILSKYLMEKMIELETEIQGITRAHYYDLVIKTFVDDLYKEWRKARMENEMNYEEAVDWMEDKIKNYEGTGHTF